MSAGNIDIVRDLIRRGFSPDDNGGDYKENDYPLPNMPEGFDCGGYGVVHRFYPLAIASGLFDTHKKKVSNLEMVKLLVESGAQINNVIWQMGKCMHLTYNQKTKQFETAVKDDDPDYSNYTATGVAKIQGNTDIYNYLKSKSGVEQR